MIIGVFGLKREIAAGGQLELTSVPLKSIVFRKGSVDSNLDPRTSKIFCYIKIDLIIGTLLIFII